MQLKRQRGHALLESALVLGVFLAFFIASIDFAQFLFFHQSLVERARAAARYAAINPTDTAGIKNVAVYNNAAGTGSAVLPRLNTSQVDVTVDSADATVDVVTVTIARYPFRFISPLIGSGEYRIPVRATSLSEAP